MDQVTTAEEWRPVLGFEGWYSVSSLGRLRRSRRGNGTSVGRILSQRKLNGPGYPIATLSVRAVHTPVRIHRLVASAFCEQREGCDFVNHKNGVKQDNRAENLEWVTKSEDALHRCRVLGYKPTGSKGEANGTAKLCDQDVRAIRIKMACGLSFSACGREYGVTDVVIHNIIKRRTWTHVV